eukprot:CAMPEP_0204917268 /NCGR_PEP_ID=MMETSP1397-20131031/14889_1 /ASSEMBLY_ACC=CAM_ASM_000891 /TAXON_ID=49980 /ORGANISM="Climacostomum Climacostomum virens, Strain Stock W-24" /LENGTH=547 /DNA_ID=CAMNT_0052090059 /DNA_START=217 /DNA_END=1860 /DNA_ORIENTATION=-
MTKAAVSGGVTVIAAEPGIYVPNTSVGSLMYCDLYLLSYATDENLFRLSEYRRSGSVALKAYLYPPSCNVQPVYDLPALFSSAQQLGITVIIDSFFPDGDRLYAASAFHHANVEGRTNIPLLDDQHFAGAFHYRANSSSEDEMDLPYLERTVTHGTSMLFIPISPATSKDSFEQADPRISRSCLKKARSNSLVSALQPIQAEPPKSKCDIYADLERRIKRNKTNYADLAKIESSTYNKVKQSFGDNSAKRVSLSSFDIDPVRKVSDTSSPLRQRRPAGMKMLRKPSNAEPPKTMSYLKFMVCCPDNWETEGVKRALSAYKAFPCKLHFANLSSAAAINKVRKLKKTFPEITCETCPHFLFFTDSSVPASDTRFKTFPPIRNQNNNILLWELLKVKAIDMIASNHSSVRPDLKFQAEGDFRKAATGFSTLGFAMQAVWTKLKAQIEDVKLLDHYIVRLSKWLSYAPAKLLGLNKTRGSLCKGQLADIVVWKPFEPVVSEVSQSVFSDASPYASMELYGRIEQVYVRGRVAYTGGQFKSVGKRLQKAYN